MILPLLLLLSGALQGQDKPTCNPQIQWIIKPDQLPELPKNTSISQLAFFSSLGSGCGAADIRLTAVYLDQAENIVCSGTVANVISQGDGTQVTMIEIRPMSLFEFVRWRSGPRPAGLAWKGLTCSRPDGEGNVQVGELERASTLRVYATILPAVGGVATAMLRLALLP